MSVSIRADNAGLGVRVMVESRGTSSDRLADELRIHPVAFEIIAATERPTARDSSDARSHRVGADERAPSVISRTAS